MNKILQATFHWSRELRYATPNQSTNTNFHQLRKYVATALHCVVIWSTVFLLSCSTSPSPLLSGKLDVCRNIPLFFYWVNFNGALLQMLHFLHGR